MPKESLIVPTCPKKCNEFVSYKGTRHLKNLRKENSFNVNPIMYEDGRMISYLTVNIIYIKRK